jgi:hypothetical protein
MRTRLLIVVALVAAPRAALACPVCFSQAGHSPMVDAALLGVLTLLAVTVGVLGGFAAFMRHVAKLSRAGACSVRLQPDPDIRLHPDSDIRLQPDQFRLQPDQTEDR